MRSQKASEPNVPQRVALLYRGARLGAELLALLGEERTVNVISSPVELASGGPADVVVVDVPLPDRRAACEQVRRHFHGPLIVLLNVGENSHDLPPDRSRILLTRPFSIRDLSVALAGPRPAGTQPAPEPVGHLRLVLPHGAQDRRKPSPVPQAVPRPAGSRRKRRAVRLSVISIAAALAFLGAFALVNRGNGCGAGCDELTGADLTSPSTGTFPAVPMGPDTIDSGAGTVASTTTAPSVSPAPDGGSGVDAATGGASRISPTTVGRSVAPSPTSPPEATRPQTSAPPSTAPKTTAPKSSTTTTTTSTTTTTTTTTPTGP